MATVELHCGYDVPLFNSFQNSKQMVSIRATSVNRGSLRNHAMSSSILTTLSGLPSIKIFIISSPQILCCFNVKRPGNSTSISLPLAAKANWSGSTASHKVFVDKSATFCWHKHVAERRPDSFVRPSACLFHFCGTNCKISKSSIFVFPLTGLLHSSELRLYVSWPTQIEGKERKGINNR